MLAVSIFNIFSLCSCGFFLYMAAKRVFIMKFGLYGLIISVFLVSGTLLAMAGQADGIFSASDSDMQWVDVNHVRVLHKGEWQEVPLMPLSEKTCSEGGATYRRYCK